MELIINHTTINTCLGTIFLAATNKGICMLEFDNEKRIQHHFKQIEQYHPIKKTDNSTGIIDTAIAQLTKYFNGDRVTFDLPLDIYGSDFQKKVWKELQNISYGNTRTYKEQAIATGNLKAIRAVANANGQNRISIIIPCHRVVGSNGSLTGYGGELWRKKKLLELESNQQKLF